MIQAILKVRGQGLHDNNNNNEKLSHLTLERKLACALCGNVFISSIIVYDETKKRI